MIAHLSPLSLFALACALLAASILIAYLVRRPALTGDTKAWLLVGLGVLPISAATTGNIEGFHTSKQRTFCGSCHVMVPHVGDSEDAKSSSLASRHARNALFGDENCYSCHADYGMYGTVVTKLGALRHVWKYVTEYHSMPIAQFEREIHLVKPFSNDNCMHCHSANLDIWLRVADHRSLLDDLRGGRVSCASGGCHGLAHPFNKASVPLTTSPRDGARFAPGTMSAPGAPSGSASP